MNVRSTTIALYLGLLTLISPFTVRADEVTCESVGHDENRCEMDTTGGVRIYKNLSKTDCIEGLNWRQGPHAVWVRSGCRAVFVSDGGSRDDWGDRHRHEERHEDRRDEAPRAPAINCPPGTHISTHRCTKEERRRGCKDYGAGNGLGCSNF